MGGRRRLVALLTVVTVLAMVAPVGSASAASGTLYLASTSDTGVKGNSGTFAPALSADGTHAAFHSYSNNFGEGSGPGTPDVYVKDLLTGQLALASTSDGGVKGNGESAWTSLSSNGARVGFQSVATNLDPADLDTNPDAYVKDLVSGDLVLVSTSDSGVKGNGASFTPSLSVDGTRAAFNSYSTNLDPADNGVGSGDVYVKNLLTGDLTLVSISEAGSPGNGYSYTPSLSADGTRVAFLSNATNLDPADTDSNGDIYLRDLATGELTLVSTSAGGVKGNSNSVQPSISADGNRVTFSSTASNLHPDDTDSLSDIFVKDLVTGEVTLVSIRADGVKGSGSSVAPEVSAGGNHVVFQSAAANLDEADIDTTTDAYMKNLVTGELLLLSKSLAGIKGNGASFVPSISADGSQVAFQSAATNLHPADPDGQPDVYVRDLALDVTAPSVPSGLSVEHMGLNRVALEWLPSTDDIGISHRVDHYVVYRDGGAIRTTPTLSFNDFTVDPDTSYEYSVSAVDASGNESAQSGSVDATTGNAPPPPPTGAVLLASMTAAGVKGNGTSTTGAISADGGRVVFGSAATNLDPADGDTVQDLYVKDLPSGDLTLVTVTEGGVKSNGFSTAPNLSAEGTVVVFQSSASNLAPRDTDANSDVFAKDLATGQLLLVSDGGTDAGASSSAPTISADGTRVAFESSANFVPRDTNFLDVYVRDLATGEFILVTENEDGVEANGSSSRASISGDGTLVAFVSSATNLHPDDLDTGSDVYVKNLETNEISLVSTSTSGVNANGINESPMISADGTHVAFFSTATNLHPNDVDSGYDVFVKNLVTGAVTLASSTGNGVKGNGNSFTATISADGSRVAFQSLATNFDSADTFLSYDVYIKDLTTGRLTLASVSASGAKGNAANQNPLLSADGNWLAFWGGSTNLHPADTDFGVGDVVVKNVTPDRAAPSVPTGLTASMVSHDEVVLEWEPSIDDDAVDHYIVYRGSVEIGTTSTTSFNDATVAAETQYGYTVVAVDAAGNASDPSEALQVTTDAAPDTTPPSAPADLSTMSVSHDEVTLGWSASTDGVGVDHYVVYREGVEIGTTTDTSFTDDTVDPETDYSYTVVAVDAAGNASDPSEALQVTTDAAPDTTPPSAPADLSTMSVSHDEVTLGWSASTDGVGVDHYVVYREGVEIGTTTDTSFTDDTVDPETDYSYTVVAVDAAGNASDPSEALQVTTDAAPDTTPPSAPADLSTMSVSHDEVTLGWSASTDGVGVDHYVVYREGVEIGTTTDTSFTDDTVDPETDYSYTVVAVDAAGNASDPSEALQVTTDAAPDTTAPSVPAGLSASSVSHDEVVLGWSPSTDGSGVVDHYVVFRDGVELGTTETTSFTDGTVDPDTTYEYTVVAVDAAGNTSDPQEALQVTTDSVPEPPPAGWLYLASASDTGGKGDSSSYSPVVSSDGTVLVFESEAANLDAADTDTGLDVFAKDLATGEITLVSATDSGVNGNGDSYRPAISADGTRVVFQSTATNLDPGDTDLFADVFVKDLVTGDVTLVSTSDTGVKGTGNSLTPSVSADGTHVAFFSSATNLDPADTGATFDVYVKDLTTGEITLVSTSDSGVKGNGHSDDPSLSADGTVVAFESVASNLDPADTDVTRDIYVKDLTTGELTLVTTSDTGVKGNGLSLFAEVSADGTRVAFQTQSTNLDPADTDSVYDIYVKDLTSGDLTLASTSDSGAKANAMASNVAISADGHRVAFYSPATNLDAADSDGTNDVFVKDLATGQVTLVSTTAAGVKGNGHSYYPSVTADATRVAFQSAATNLDPADTDTLYDIYVKDLTAAPDTTPPSTPSGLSATSVSHDEVVLEWSPSTDDNGVVDHYVVFRDGVELGTTETASFTDGTVDPDTTYEYTVVAVDAAGNTSDPQEALQVTTDLAPDVSPPSVAMDTPSDGAIVSGSVTVEVSASDDHAVASIELMVDGVTVATSTGGSLTHTWDTTALTDGEHSLTASATDTSGNSATSPPVTVTVTNAEPGQVTATPNPALVGETVTFTDAHTGRHRRTVGFGDGTTTSGKTQTFTHVYTTPGTYTATINTIDLDTGTRTTMSLTVVVTAGSDTVPPTVTITSPVAGTVLGGTAEVAVDATDNIAVAEVEIFVDGTSVGTLTTAPWTYPWDTTTAGDGDHTLTAVATDTTGNAATSEPVTVTVDQTAPSGQFTATPTTVTVGQTVTFTDTHTGRHRRVLTFGDGTETAGKGTTFTKTYATPGTYTATLHTRSVDTGERIALTVTITVTGN